MLDGEVEFEESDIDEGLACAEAAIARGVPRGHEVKVEFLNIRAHRTLDAGESDAAFAAWGSIAAAYPTYLAAYSMRAEILEKRGDDAAALAMLDSYVRRAPTDPDGYLARANFFTKHDDPERAIANFRRVVQLDPARSDALLRMAQLLEAKGDSYAASCAYAKYAEEPLDDVDDYKMRAFMFFMSGYPDLALDDYDAILALSPNDREALSWRANLRLMFRQWEGAITACTRLIKMKSADATVYARRGEALVEVGKLREALKDLKRAIALGGDARGVAHFARGKAEEGLGDDAAALASYTTAIERDPSSVGRRLRRLRINEAVGDRPACQIDIDAMLSAPPGEPSPLLAYARVCHARRRREDSREAYDRLIALEPHNAAAFYGRAELLVGLGDTMAARADFARAFELKPDDAEIELDMAASRRVPQRRPKNAPRRTSSSRAPSSSTGTTPRRGRARRTTCAGQQPLKGPSRSSRAPSSSTRTMPNTVTSEPRASR